MKRLLPLLLGLGLLAGLSACASRSGPTGLAIEVARLVRTADGGVTVELVFVNPSVVALNIASSTHTLSVEGRPVGRFTLTEAMGLAAQSRETQTARLPAEAARALPPAGAVAYRLESDLTLRLYGDATERSKSASSGTLQVVPAGN